jgi:hypothetical protein
MPSSVSFQEQWRLNFLCHRRVDMDQGLLMRDDFPLIEDPMVHGQLSRWGSYQPYISRRGIRRPLSNKRCEGSVLGRCAAAKSKAAALDLKRLQAAVCLDK